MAADTSLQTDDHPSPPSADINGQLAAILDQLQSLSTRIERLEDKLLLVSDVDKYQQLQTYLANGQFKEADGETARLILDTLGKDNESVTPDNMLGFPCNVLRVIDRLWRYYSGDRFGLSVQLNLYLSVGGSIDTLRTQDAKIIEKFGEQVGWRKNGEWQASNYQEWDFSLQAPRGCFPAGWWKSPYGLKMVAYCFMRLLACDLTDVGS